MRRITYLLISACLLSGCATSKITGFRDPDFTTKQFTAIVVFAQGMTLSASVEVERLICMKLAPTPCVSGKSVLPPTRQYTADEVRKYLQPQGADAVFIIALVADQSDTRYFGTITSSWASASAIASGSMNFYGNTAFWNGAAYGSASGGSVSMPVYRFSRVAFGQLGLFDRLTGNIAWRGEIRIKGQGLLNITDNAFISSATSKIAHELKAAGLVK
jgi:PBP1b-binding outer membrane lipoprotein LpoB